MQTEETHKQIMVCCEYACLVRNVEVRSRSLLFAVNMTKLSLFGEMTGGDGLTNPISAHAKRETLER